MDRFYLTLKEGGVEINACVANLLNLSYAPLPIRFIREVTLAKNKLLYPFSWGPLAETAAFLPRVRFEKTILSLAKWQLNATHMANKPLEEVISTFIAWADRWNLPQCFLLANEDQQLFLDRTHPAHVLQIAHRIKKGESLKFLEYLDDSWMKSEQESHCSEIVFPFIKNPLFTANKPSFNPIAYLPISFENRWKLPASEWLFAKFYLDDEEKESFLLQQLSPFSEHLRQKREVKGWFFVRYNDPESHLRLRLRLQSSESFFSVMLLLQKTAMEWMKEGLIKNMVLANYEREIERYGGSELIEAAEDVFCADTLATTYLLHSLKKHLSLHEAILHPLSIVHFLIDLGLNQEECISILENQQSEQSELQGFRKHKQLLTSLIQAFDNNHLGRGPNPKFVAERGIHSSKIEILRKASSLRRPAMEQFRIQSQALDPFALKAIFKNFLHMHCNRLGCNNSTEKRAALYALHSLLHIQRTYLSIDPASTANFL